jgi:hypothetical protein
MIYGINFLPVEAIPPLYFLISCNVTVVPPCYIYPYIFRVSLFLFFASSDSFLYETQKTFENADLISLSPLHMAFY